MLAWVWVESVSPLDHTATCCRIITDYCGLFLFKRKCWRQGPRVLRPRYWSQPWQTRILSSGKIVLTEFQTSWKLILKHLFNTAQKTSKMHHKKITHCDVHLLNRSNSFLLLFLFCSSLKINELSYTTWCVASIVHFVKIIACSVNIHPVSTLSVSLD